jgi:hypothetical protein
MGAFPVSSRWREKRRFPLFILVAFKPIGEKAFNSICTTHNKGQRTAEQNILAKKNPIIPLPGQHIIAHLDAAQT